MLAWSFCFKGSFNPAETADSMLAWSQKRRWWQEAVRHRAQTGPGQWAVDSSPLFSETLVRVVLTMLLLVQLRWLRPSLQQITQNKTVLGIRHWHFYKEVAWAGKSGLKLYGNMIKDGKGALEIREKKCQWYSISIIPVISSRIPHFYNKCLRRIYQQNRLDVGGYTADHRSLALALVGKLECVHLVHVVDMERLICRCIDDKFIFHKYVLGRMPSNSCCCCPPASSWVQDLGGARARGVTYCGRDLGTTQHAALSQSGRCHLSPLLKMNIFTPPWVSNSHTDKILDCKL